VHIISMSRLQVPVGRTEIKGLLQNSYKNVTGNFKYISMSQIKNSKQTNAFAPLIKSQVALYKFDSDIFLNRYFFVDKFFIKIFIKKNISIKNFGRYEKKDSRFLG